jgi:nitroimidazol reductase NimA-like FMN-containing flavoprotein (pyridoxamine 5'-phosphate oxidase superfamily)
MPATTRAFESLSQEQSLTLLGRVQIGRAVYTVGALPAIVPVTFAVLDAAVVICTAGDSRLAQTADRNVVVFEADEIDSAKHTGWSVVVTGIAEVVTDPTERARLHDIVVPWAPGDRDTLIRIPVTMLTGRRIVETSHRRSSAETPTRE